ncbi:MAG: hypothetical protein HGA93_01340 [Methanothrix sp.]|nr:hypothetical protein [Methanothrix sp.]
MIRMLQKTISASIALVLALVYLMPACTALGIGIMAIEEKNGFSHRALAVHKFSEWYKEQ